MPISRNIQGGGNEPRLWRNDVAEYTVVLRDDYNATITKRLLADGTVTTHDLESGSNLLGLPLHDTDGHYRLALCVDDDGYIWLVGNDHDDSTTRNFVRSANPNDITSWVDGNTFIDDSAAGAGYYTYNYFASCSNGTVLWAFSQGDQLAGQVLGRDWCLFRKESGWTDWEPWAGTGEIAVCNEVDDDGDPERAYIVDLHVGESGSAYIVGLWQMQAGDQDTRSDPYVIKSEDHGETWTTIDGTALTTPVTKAITEAASNCAVPDHLTIVLGANSMCEWEGRPYVATTTYANCRVHYWDGSAWQQAATFFGNGNTGLVALRGRGVYQTWHNGTTVQYLVGLSGHYAGPDSFVFPTTSPWTVYSSPTDLGQYRIAAARTDREHRVIGVGAGFRNFGAG